VIPVIDPFGDDGGSVSAQAWRSVRRKHGEGQFTPNSKMKSCCAGTCVWLLVRWLPA